MSAEPQYLEDMGIPTSAIPPPDLSLLYRDSPEDKDVRLVVWFDKPEPADRRWGIGWTVGWAPSGAEVLRLLHLMQEPNFNGLTNWGPLTRPLSEEDARLTKRFPIARLSLDARQRLERIAAKTQVQAPDGQYGSQHWVVEVLKQAVEANLLSNSQCRAATHAAWSQ